MATMQLFRKVVDSLKDVNLPVATKLQNYTSLRNILSCKLTKEDAVKNEGTLQCLFDCIKSDVAEDSHLIRQSALTSLDQLYKSTWRNFVIQDLTNIYIYVIFDDVTKDKDDLRATALQRLQCVVKQQLLHNDCDPEKLLLKVSKDVARKKILELLEKACNDVPSQQSLLFLYEKVVPTMFNTSHADIRGCLVEFLLASLTKFEISSLSSDKLEKFKISTKKMYVEKTVKLLESGDPHWNNVWIFLVRCHGKRLHAHGDVMNALLKVVEVAFRSKVIHNNSAAYDCWKELIDVYSLDMVQMCSPKYMKLLLLPLKNNALKNGNLTKKRFEIWTHLISILQEKSNELCMRQFLEFCFGPLGDNPLITRGNPNIGSPARNDPELWQASAQALLEIMGHCRHDDSNSCMCYTNYPLLKLEKPLITPQTFMAMDYIIINSVGECCSLMINRMNKESTKNSFIKIITCLWNSLFHIIEQLEKSDQESAIRRVTALLVVCVELSNETPAYFDYILKPVFELLSSKRLFHIDVPRFNTQLLFPLLKKFLKHNDDVFLSGRNTILELLQCSKNIRNKNSWLEEAFEIFLKSDVKKGNIKGLLSFWADCADVLNDICEFPTAQTEKVVQGVGIGFMVWPVLNMYRLPLDQTIIITEVSERWGKAFASMLKTYTKESLTILMDIQGNIDTSPFIASHVAQLFPGFQSLLDTEPNHKFVMILLNQTSTLLGIPTVTKEVKRLLLPTVLLIMNYFTRETEAALKYSDFQHMCQCFEYLLHLHKEFSILEPMENFFDKISKTFQENVPQSLCTVVGALKTHSDNNISRIAQKLSTKFIVSPVDSSKTEETFLQPKFMLSSRAVKITNMAIATPKSPKADNPGGTTVLRLLGHKVETPSPVRVRGSQISSSGQPQKRKAANVFPEVKKSKIRVDDEEASYVLIDQQYQFDPTKLSEHQMEVMKKRRPDIPALYQDLSQSQSNSQSFVNIAKIADNQNEAEEKSGSKSSINHNEALVKNTTKPVVTNNVATSEDLFQTEDINAANALSSNSYDKKENLIDSGDKKPIESESVSVQNVPKSPNSGAQANECKTDEKGVNGKLLKIPLPKIEETAVSGTKGTKEDMSRLNQQTPKARRGRPRILKPKTLEKVNSGKAVEASDKSDVVLSSSESHLKQKIDDPVCGDDKSVIKSSKESVDHDSDHSCSARIDLKIQNPSMKIIEAMIAEDSPTSNYNQGFLSVILKQPTSSDDGLQQENPISNVVENKQMCVDEEYKNQDSLSGEEKKRLKIRKELNKIKMDIVGGDAFVRNLNLTERVRTRRSADVANLRSASKINYDSDDSKSSSSSDSSRKSKLRATVKIVEKALKDKLPLSPKSSIKLRQAAAPRSPVKNNNDTSNHTKLSPVRHKIVLVDTDIETEKTKQIKTRRSSVTPEVPSRPAEENTGPTTRRSKSVTPEKPAELVEENVSPGRRKSRGDKNWIAKVNKSLEECAKHGKVGARKSLANVLESAAKADTSLKDNVSLARTNSPAKTNKMKPKLPEAECKDANGAEFTVTLVGNAESQNSEDVIESSQESCIEIKPCQNLDNSLENIRKGINLQIEEVVTQLRQKNVQNLDDTVGLMIEKQTQDLNLGASTSDFEADKAESSRQDVENKISMDSLSGFSPDELMRMDLASHIKPDQNNTCEMDTESLELLSNTPAKLVSIPTSPIASDTPTRTSELISNTLNISPIKLVPKSTNRENNSEKTPDLFDSEPGTSNKASTPKLDGPSENNCDSVQNVTCQQLATPSCSTISDKANQRSLKLLRMLAHTPPPENYNVQKVKQTPKLFISSPKTHRIVKMMKTFEKKTEPEGVEEIVELDHDEEPTNVIQEKDILKFVKELPSPMASPRYSILKRRAPDSRDEGLSPPRKKRVNFSDPPTTCEKVFFKDKHEHSYGKKNDYNEDTGDDNNTNAQEMEKLSTSSTNTEPPFLEPMEYVEPPILEAVKTTPTVISNHSSNGQPLNIGETCSEKETESLGMETQGSVDTRVPCLLECSQPILPEFVDCNESIDCVVGKMASPLFCFALVDELHKKKIFTIGDLAKLTEIEVTRLPFRTPKLLVVRSSLRKFMSQKSIEGASIESKTNEDVEDKSATIINDKETEEKSKGIINDEEHKRNSILTVKKQNSLADNSPDNKVLSVTSDGPKVKIVSSIILQPARTVPQNSTKIDKTPRRVPLIKITSPNTPCNTFMQVESAATLEPSSSKVSDGSKTVIFGNAEEREKLRSRIPELIADFQEMREKVKRQGLSTTSLYELIIEIVGTEQFLSILQGNGALSINHFVKNDGWCALINQILYAIGLNKTISCLCNACTVTPLKLIDSIIDHITTEQEGKNCSSSLEKIAYRVLKAVPLPNILQKFGMRRIVDALCDMNKCLEFTVEDFFQHATFRFSPSLDDMVPSFRNINIVHLSDKVVQLSSCNKNDFDVFKKNIGAVVEAPTFSEICKNQNSKTKDIVKCIPEIKKEEVMHMLFNELPQPEDTVFALVDKISIEKQKQLAFSMFDKMSDVDAYNCWYSYFSKRLRKT